MHVGPDLMQTEGSIGGEGAGNRRRAGDSHVYASAMDHKIPSDVVAHSIEMDTSSFDFIVKESELTLINFYAPWCSHCQVVDTPLSCYAERFCLSFSRNVLLVFLVWSPHLFFAFFLPSFCLFSFSLSPLFLFFPRFLFSLFRFDNLSSRSLTLFPFSLTSLLSLKLFQVFKPKWEKTAFLASQKEYAKRVSFGKVDCTSQIGKPICTRAHITAYPTVLLYIGGSADNAGKGVGAADGNK